VPGKTAAPPASSGLTIPSNWLDALEFLFHISEIVAAFVHRLTLDVAYFLESHA
jgi:hypothetical protein